MPNWCGNETIIKGSVEEIQQFLELAGYDAGNIGKPIKSLCEPFVPRPDFGADDNDEWYKWSLDNWGSKWSPEVWDVSLSPDGQMVALSYDTAWSPITQFWKTVSDRFESFIVDNRYIEEGMSFIGQAIIRDGVIQAEVCDELDIDHYKTAGAILDENGDVDWDVEQDYNLWENFPIVEVEVENA